MGKSRISQQAINASLRTSSHRKDLFEEVNQLLSNYEKWLQSIGVGSGLNRAGISLIDLLYNTGINQIAMEDADRLSFIKTLRNQVEVKLREAEYQQQYIKYALQMDELISKIQGEVFRDTKDIAVNVNMAFVQGKKRGDDYLSVVKVAPSEFLKEDVIGMFNLGWNNPNAKVINSLTTRNVDANRLNMNTTKLRQLIANGTIESVQEKMMTMDSYKKILSSIKNLSSDYGGLKNEFFTKNGTPSAKMMGESQLREGIERIWSNRDLNAQGKTQELASWLGRIGAGTEKLRDNISMANIQDSIIKQNNQVAGLDSVKNANAGALSITFLGTMARSLIDYQQSLSKEPTDEEMAFIQENVGNILTEDPDDINPLAEEIRDAFLAMWSEDGDDSMFEEYINEILGEMDSG